MVCSSEDPDHQRDAPVAAREFSSQQTAGASAEPRADLHATILQDHTQEAKLPSTPAATEATSEVKRDNEQQAKQEGQGGGKSEKEEAMAKARAPTQTKAQDFNREGERTVVDPVTGVEVVIKDAELKGASRPMLASR